MKKSPQKQSAKQDNKDKPFTTGEAKRMFGAVQEHFDGNFKVINERFDMMDEKFERKFALVDRKLDQHGEKLDEHALLLGRILVDAEEIKSGMREKVSVQDFNKLETRLVLLESIVFTGGRKRGKVKTKSGK